MFIPDSRVGDSNKKVVYGLKFVEMRITLKAKRLTNCSCMYIVYMTHLCTYEINKSRET